ncbi:Alpha/Beta hydrolase protein [Endogone sp. FLAS-F59071]|nr:Alpha/Beta hydrolase protein [Endogone sp. FLAS-F59071]|eukprot:RUS17369.1 Alpha/Beta hydrolase protein [Endogone sp. FLAS-F59071]
MYERTKKDNPLVVVTLPRAMQSIRVQPPNIPKVLNVKPPKPSATPLKFKYTPSRDGVDLNLLILLHGLGDTEKPFAQLGEKLQLPQTATLAIRAPTPIPFLDDGFQWFPAFNLSTGEDLPATHPSRLEGLHATRTLLSTFLTTHLVPHCGFDPSCIFIFGFSQGGSVALDLALFGETRNLGGVVSVMGYLLDMQVEGGNKEKVAENAYEGAVLVLQGEKDEQLGGKAVGEKKFEQLKQFCSPDAKLSQLFIPKKGHQMPNSEREWHAIHTFFAAHLARRNLQLEAMSDVYEVSRAGA